MVTPNLYTGPSGFSLGADAPNQLNQTLAEILAIRRENLRRSGDWETIQREGFATRQRDQRTQLRRLAERDREAGQLAMSVSPGVRFGGTIEAYQQQQRRQLQNRRDEQARGWQRAAMGAQPGVGIIGFEDAQRQKQQRDQAQEEVRRQALQPELERQAGFWSQVRSQYPRQRLLQDFERYAERAQDRKRTAFAAQPGVGFMGAAEGQAVQRRRNAAELERQERLRVAAPFNLQQGLSLDAPQRELGEWSAIESQLRGAIEATLGSERTVQTNVGFERVSVPPQPDAMKQFIIGLQAADPATQYRVGTILQNDPALRIDMQEAASFNIADNYFKEYFDPATGVFDVLGAVTSEIWQFAKESAVETVRAVTQPVVDVNTGDELVDTTLDVVLAPITWLTGGAAPGIVLGSKLVGKPVLRRVVAIIAETLIGTAGITAGEKTGSLPAGLGVAAGTALVVLNPKSFMRALVRLGVTPVVAARFAYAAAAEGIPAALQRLDPASTLRPPQLLGEVPTRSWAADAPGPFAFSPAQQRALAEAAADQPWPGGPGGYASDLATATPIRDPLAISRVDPPRLSPAERVAEAAAAARAQAESAVQGLQGVGLHPGSISVDLGLGSAAVTAKTAIDDAVEAALTAAARKTAPYARDVELADSPLLGRLAYAGQFAIEKVPIIRSVVPKTVSDFRISNRLTPEMVETLKPITPEVAEVIVAARATTMPLAVARFQTMLDTVEPEELRALANLARSRSVGEKRALAEPFQELGTAAGAKEVRAAFKGRDIPEEMLELPDGALIKVMDEGDYDDLVAHIQSGEFWDSFHAMEALNDLVLRGRVPGKRRLEDLRKALGDETVNVLVAKFTSLGRELWLTLMDAVNFPRAIMASTDISMLMRQGLPLISRNFYREHLSSLLPVMRSDDVARQLDAELRIAPEWMDEAAIAARGQLDLLDNPGMSTSRTHTPEEFRSELADEFPFIKGLRFIRASNRAYVYTGNWLRTKYFDHVAEIFRGLPDVTANDYKNLARWVNVITGRGETRLPIFGEIPPGLMNFASDTMFSPRFLASRLQMLFAPLHPTFSPAGLLVPGRSAASRQLRKEVAKDLVTYYVAWGTGLGLAKLSGFEVQLDPGHANFGVMKLGNLRLDMSAGQAGLMRTIHALVTGESIRTGTGEIMERPLEKTVAGFARAKLSPQAAFLIDVVTGETFSGEQITAARLAQSNLLPITVQELWEVIKQEGLLTGLATAPFVVAGVGVGVYTALGDVLEEEANKLVKDDGTPFRFVELNVDQRKEVFASEAVQEIFGDVGDEIPLDVQTTASFNLVNNKMALAEQEVADKLLKAGFIGPDGTAFTTDEVAAMPGGIVATTLDLSMSLESQATLLRGLMQEKALLYAAIFANPDILAQSEERAEDYFVEDRYALEWHSQEVLKDPVTEIVDYYTRDLQRDRIVAEGVAAIEGDPAAMERLRERGSTPEEYITGRGQGTFVGVQWDNQVVANAMYDYREVTDALGDTDYYRKTRDKPWENLLLAHPGLEEQALRIKQLYEDFHEDVPDAVPWRNTFVHWVWGRTQKRLLDVQGESAWSGFSRDTQLEEARNRVMSSPDAAAYSRRKNAKESAWVKANPDLAQRAYNYGLLDLTGPELEEIYRTLGTE